MVVLPPPSLAILEKPRSKADQMGMLQDYNGSEVSVITAVTLGMWTKMSNREYRAADRLCVQCNLS